MKYEYNKLQGEDWKYNRQAEGSQDKELKCLKEMITEGLRVQKTSTV